jgi:ELWxxDGT repeat protein
MLNDINPGSGSSLGANSFWVVGSNLFFRADDGVHGTELWVTDGTPTGTHLVKDIVVGSGSPTFLGDTGFVAAGGRLFFSVNDGVNGMEPWVSDGTEAGTYIVQDINPGAASSNPGSFALLGSRIYYGATDATHGSELWSTDFTTLATEMVKDIYASGGSGPIYLANCNGTLFFQAMDSQGWELWKSDGTEGGTVMVKDIVPGASSSQPSNLKAVGSTLYFTATTPGEGWELWQSDGTDSGTVMVRDIRVGVTGSNPGWLCDVGGTLFFQANDGTGSDLWRTDATFGAVKVNTSISNITPLYITAFGGQAYFQATDPTHGTEPWVSDGTDAGTHILFDLVP